MAQINFRTLTLPTYTSPHKFILNVSLLKDQDVNITIKMIRLINLQNKSLSHINRWLLNISSWTKIFQTFGQKKAKDYRRIEQVLTNRLFVAENNIQSQPDSISLAEQVSMARNSLRRHQHVKAKGAFIRARNHWLQFGDKGTKYFFNPLKEKQSRERIDRIFDNDKELLTDQDISLAFETFYKNLFTSEDNDTSRMMRLRCSELIPKVLSEDDISALQSPVSQ